MKNNYLLECNDSISLESKINEIIDKNHFSEGIISIYDLEDTLLDNALEDLDTYNFLSNKKIIIIKNVFNDATDKKLEHLLKYIDNSNPDNLLIITTRKIDNRLNICKKIKKNNNIEIVTVEINAYDYVKKLCDNYKIDNFSISLLVDLCKNDITRLNSEINKLKMYKINELEINKEDINNLVIKKLGDSNEILFSLIKYIISKDKKNAFITYNQLKEYNIDVNSIIGLMASQIKLTHQIKILDEENLSNQDITDKLNLKSVYQVKKIKEYIHKYTYDDIYDFVHKISNIDLAIKSGKLDSNIAIDMLIINL